MDIQLKKKPWFVRHKYYVSGGIVFLSLAAYTVALLFSPEKQRVSADTLGLAEAVQADFLEYVEQEGVVQPMLSLRVNSRISGYVERIVAEEGARVRQGDTLLVLSNPELLDEMEVQENALHKQLMSYREQEIEMEQKTLLLRKQVLQNRYELQRISDSYALSQEEFRMGIKSKAELEVARQEYEYKTRAAELEQALQAVHEHMTALAGEITAIRKNTALQVQTQVEQALHDMEMAQARFYISMEKRENFATDGLDKVEFLISANAGEDLKPLAKIASGGEMSRVMLALKTVLVDADEIGTFIFDEIDTGVSGKTARKVGEKMSLLGKKRQILCITHLPQIAAMADNHFRIEKHVAEGRTTTTVETLDENASCREIARLMGGEEITETTMAAARELRQEKP